MQAEQDVKAMLVRPIAAAVARPFVRAHHYSGKVVQNSVLHLGVFWNGELEGVMQFGSPLDKRRILGLVAGTRWDGMLELNRMAFSDALPRNSESRALAIAFRMIRKRAPQVKWVISFADGTASGDGSIYRATGFVLTAIKKNTDLYVMPDGSRIHEMSIKTGVLRDRLASMAHGKNSARDFVRQAGGKPAAGFQLRYIYFIDPAWRARLTVPEIPFSEIEARGAGMYLGQPRERGETDSAPGSNRETGGASPTRSLSDQDAAAEARP